MSGLEHRPQALNLFFTEKETFLGLGNSSSVLTVWLCWVMKSD